MDHASPFVLGTVMYACVGGWLQMKLLVGTLDSLNVNAKKNVLNALRDVRPSHLLDQVINLKRK